MAESKRARNHQDEIWDRIDLDDAVSESAADQTAADADQDASDEDQDASESDESASHSDQAASDADQEAADHHQRFPEDLVDDDDYDSTRSQRREASLERERTASGRAQTALDRPATSAARDAVAAGRDRRAIDRDKRAAELEQTIAAFDPDAAREFERFRARAAADRAAAARDRARAAKERSEADRARQTLVMELHTAHLDDLTGAYRREMGLLALSKDTDRALRGDQRYVVVFIDVDRLKSINDKQGHPAGDEALRCVVRETKERLRSYDVICRYGGDEFIVGMGNADIAEAERRFADISASLPAGLSISVGFASLDELTGVADLIASADRDLYRRRKASRATE